MKKCLLLFFTLFLTLSTNCLLSQFSKFTKDLLKSAAIVYGINELEESACEMQTAFHEAAHAVLAYELDGKYKPTKAEIVYQQQPYLLGQLHLTGGQVTTETPEEYEISEQQLLNQMKVSFAGAIQDELYPYGLARLNKCIKQGLTNLLRQDPKNKAQEIDEIFKNTNYKGDVANIHTIALIIACRHLQLDPKTSIEEFDTNQELQTTISKLIQKGYEGTAELVEQYKSEIKAVGRALLNKKIEKTSTHHYTPFLLQKREGALLYSKVLSGKEIKDIIEETKFPGTKFLKDMEETRLKLLNNNQRDIK